MGVGAGLYMYVVVVQKFTFAISHLLMSSCNTISPCLSSADSVGPTDDPTYFALVYIHRVLHGSAMLGRDRNAFAPF